MRVPDVGPARPRGDGKNGLSFSKVASHVLKIPGRLDIAGWNGKGAPERRWVVDGLLPEGNVTMLAGEGGIGKSVLALQLISACALGKAWVGRHARPCKVVGVFCEDDEAEIWRRLEAVARHYGASASDLAEQVALWSRVGQENLLMTWADQFGQGEATGLFIQISNVAVDVGAELVVLDSLHDLFGGNENIRAHARQFIGELRGLAMDIQGAVLLTAHPSLTGRNTGTGEAGSTAWNNAVRQRLYLTTPKGEEGQDEPPNGLRELRTMKANYTAAGDRIKLHWQEGVFVAEEEPQGILGAIERRTAEQALLEGIAALAAQGVSVSHGRTAPNFAPRVIAKTVHGRGNSAGELERMLFRLIEARKLRVVETGAPSRRRTHLEVVTEAAREEAAE